MPSPPVPPVTTTCRSWKSMLRPPFYFMSSSTAPALPLPACGERERNRRRAWHPLSHDLTRAEETARHVVQRLAAGPGDAHHFARLHAGGLVAGDDVRLHHHAHVLLQHDLRRRRRRAAL